MHGCRRYEYISVLFSALLLQIFMPCGGWECVMSASSHDVHAGVDRRGMADRRGWPVGGG